jgi:hypothetical protein
MDDLFTEPGVRLETTIGRPPPEPRPSQALPRWAWATPLRMTVTTILFGAVAFNYALGVKIVLYPAAAIACQCIRRWHAVRWALWTVVGASLGADILALGTWPLRFVACALLIGPLVLFAGSQLRDI